MLAATLTITAFLDSFRMTATLAIVASLNSFGIGRAIVYANYFTVKRTAFRFVRTGIRPFQKLIDSHDSLLHKVARITPRKIIASVKNFIAQLLVKSLRLIIQCC